MKRSLFTILAILLTISVAITLHVYNANRIDKMATKHNQQYEMYCNKKILGTDLISLINKAIDYNEKNNIPKQKDSIYYVNNNTNSIQISVKFIENDKIIEMEDIAEKQTETFIKFFATFKLLNSGNSNALLAPSKYILFSSLITLFSCSITGFITFKL